MEEINKESASVIDTLINEINMLRMASFTLADTVSKILVDKKIITETEWLTYLGNSRQDVAYQLIEEATNAATQNPNLVEKEGPIQATDYVEVSTTISTSAINPKEEPTVIKEFKSIFRVSDDPQISEKLVGKDKGFCFEVPSLKENSNNHITLKVIRILSLKTQETPVV